MRSRISAREGADLPDGADLRNVFDAYQAEFQKVRLEIVLLRPFGRSGAGGLRCIDPARTGPCRLPGSDREAAGCASPDAVRIADYVRVRNAEASRDLVAHRCLSFLPTGNIWTFENRHGPIAIEVKRG